MYSQIFPFLLIVKYKKLCWLTGFSMFCDDYNYGNLNPTTSVPPIHDHLTTLLPMSDTGGESTVLSITTTKPAASSVQVQNSANATTLVIATQAPSTPSYVQEIETTVSNDATGVSTPAPSTVTHTPQQGATTSHPATDTDVILISSEVPTLSTTQWIDLTSSLPSQTAAVIIGSSTVHSTSPISTSANNDGNNGINSSLITSLLPQIVNEDPSPTIHNLTSIPVLQTGVISTSTINVR